MNNEVDQIRARLQALEQERRLLERRLLKVKTSRSEAVSVTPPAGPVTNNSPAAEKIALFRRLFGGRTDVFPARWDNPKSGRSGYAPVCANEWVRGVCGKPQVKCGD
ncbi:MAG: TOTE conflict system archaeo-eukaryotic primase domain-containing protein, partial [Hyphomicrobium sp.]